MPEIEKKHLFMGGFTIIILVTLYFLHSYLTIRIVHNELKNIAKEKKKRLLKQNQIIQRDNTKRQKMSRDTEPIPEKMSMTMEMKHQEIEQQEMDSYIDPGIEEDIDQIQEQDPSRASSKLSKNNIMMRDMMDGSRQ